MKLAMEDGSTLPFDIGIELKDQNTLIATRTGFKGTAIGVWLGGHLFEFRQPISFSISDSIKAASGFARLLSEGDECDRFIVYFHLTEGFVDLYTSQRVPVKDDST